RGRAQDSKCILITSKKEQVEKEKLNFLQEKMMYEAIHRVQHLDKGVLLEKVIVDKRMICLRVS
ncbi:hypothetical protein scyTo_0024267, partial [Scyliorhinus torazame]|nr:hypothetical protein [Scyliorhinus torazame]